MKDPDAVATRPPVYLDHNATTPVDPGVARAMLPFLTEHFGNPSSAHAFGRAPARAVSRAREQVAALFGCRPSEIVFTSGGTEANNHAILGVARANRRRGNHVVTSAVEHPAVLAVCDRLREDGFAVTVVPVDRHGRVSPSDVEAAIVPSTILVTVMHANNEVGTIQPIERIADVAHRRGILVHSDCAQSVGKVPVGLERLGLDLVSVAGHKIYGPKGVGALLAGSRVKLDNLMLGAGQESGRRPGTQNVAGIVGLGEACRLIADGLEAHASHMLAMRDRLELGLRERLPRLAVNGHPTERLPNTSSVSFGGLPAASILAGLRQVAVSSGSACHSGRDVPSSVLEAMGLPSELALSTLRFSVGRHTTAADVDLALAEVVAVVEGLSRLPAAPGTCAE